MKMFSNRIRITFSLPFLTGLGAVIFVMTTTFGVAAQGAKCHGRTTSNQRVTQISQEWAKFWSGKNADALAALYTQDAVFLPADGSRVTGRTAIRELFAKALATNSPELQVCSKVTGQSETFAYDSGEYDETISSGGVKRSGHGNYLVILRRDGKRGWRISQHMWTDAPPTRPEYSEMPLPPTYPRSFAGRRFMTSIGETATVSGPQMAFSYLVSPIVMSNRQPI